MTINELEQIFYSDLKEIYNKEEIRSFYFIILETFANLSKTYILTNKNEVINNNSEQKILDSIKQLKQYKPIQYILGKTEFYNLPFIVNNNVLIPRPETEELVYLIIKNNKVKNPNILDICTGSGCIAISLKKNISNSRVDTWEISDKAIEVANKNCSLNNANVNIIKNDALNPIFDKNKKYDIIVSNPPYVRNLEKQQMHNNVLNHEPHLALFVPDDNPLLFYKQIADYSRKLLSDKGILYFEINEAFAQEIKNMLIYLKYSSIDIIKDINEKDRIVKAVFNN